MSRQISVIRRRPKIIDIVTPFVYGTTEYRVKWATSYSGSFTQIIAASGMGYCDPAVNKDTLQSIFNSGQVRIVFDPTAANWSITDPNKPFWIQFTRYNGSTETYISPPTLLLPDEANHGIGVTTISGTAPNVAAGSALQLDFPSLVSDLHVRNESGISIAVSTEPSGDEMIIPTGISPQQVTLLGTAPMILIRGVGNTAVVSMTFTRALAR